MQKVLKTYLNRLINLRSNNRSIYHAKISRQQDLEFGKLNFLLEYSSFQILEKVISGANSIEICKVLDSKNESSNEVSKNLKKIQRKAGQLLEERGVNDLFIGWPYVQGKLMDGTLIRCPLIFFPYDLKVNSKGNWALKKRAGENPFFNKNFLLAYSYFNQTPLNEELLEEDFCEFSGDFLVFRTQLYELLKMEQFELNFNQDLFSNDIKTFQNFRKPDFEHQEKNGEIKLISNAVLGVFPQHTSFLFPDYTKLIDESKIDDLETFFKSKNLDIDRYQKESFSSEQYLLNAFPIDAYQEQVLKKVKEGSSLVVQGPPGTGKSQLICNIITDYISRGKKVLVICQKRAALDVVSERLSEKGIQKFIGLIHDFISDRKNLYQQINSQIENIEDYQIRNNKLDTVYQERQFKELSNQINIITQELDEFKDALFDMTYCGKSIKELYLISDRNKPFVDLQQLVEHFTFENLLQLKTKIGNYLLYAEKFENEGYLLKDRVNYGNFKSNDLKRIQDTIEEVFKYSDEFKNKLKSILVESFEMNEVDWVLERKSIFDDILELVNNDRCYGFFKQFIGQAGYEKSKIEPLLNQLEGIIDEGEYDFSIKKEELGEVMKRLQSSKSARNNPFKWFFWRMFSKDRYLIKRALVANALDLNRKSIKLLEYKVDARLNLEHNLTTLKNLNWGIEIPDTRQPEDVMEWVTDLRCAFDARELYRTLRSFKEFFIFKGTTLTDFKYKVDQLYKALTQLKTRQKSWFKYISPTELHLLTEKDGYYEQYLKVLQKDFDSLTEFDEIVTSLNEPEKNLIDKLKEKSGSYNEDRWIDLLNNGLAMAWIEKIESKHPVLRKASTKRFQKLEKELQEAIKEKREISKEIMLIKAREITYNSAEYNRLKNMTTYRELGNQVTKKRRIWPLRKLISNYWVELMDLIPCWLCSPETASAIFPLEQIFDLVIFDEASQCYSEKSIPSMARARQVVVVGDSKQLQPNDLYQIRWEEEDTEDLPDLEAESILDLASFYLNSYSLKQHYRSKSLELIDFSNRSFYNKKLHLIPDFKDITDEERRPVEYITIKNGKWENNVNLPEAEKVVELVIEMIENNLSSIGVVTFNYHQQQLILDLLEETAVKKEILIPKGLFIKNIENVQGDERDIIIFSTGYARDGKGALRMHFGSLNMIGGENRLNVAVTRARDKIIIVSSLHPDELKTDNIKHDGPKLFKEYLKYAFDIAKGNYTPTPFESQNLKTDNYLKQRILEQAADASLELPFADVTVKHDGQYISLVLTDDDLYYESPSAKDAHAYYPLFLKYKHWKFERRYSRDEWLKED